MSNEKERNTKMAAHKEKEKEKAAILKVDATEFVPKKDPKLEAELKQLKASQDELKASLSEIKAALLAGNAAGGGNSNAGGGGNNMNDNNNNHNNGGYNRYNNRGRGGGGGRRGGRARCGTCTRNNAARCNHCFRCEQDDHQIGNCPQGAGNQQGNQRDNPAGNHQ